MQQEAEKTPVREFHNLSQFVLFGNPFPVVESVCVLAKSDYDALSSLFCILHMCITHPFFLCTSRAVRWHSFVYRTSVIRSPSFGRFQAFICIIRLIFARVESLTKTDLRLEVAT